MTPQPRPLSPYIKWIMLGGPVIALGVIWVLFHKPLPTYALADLKPSTNRWWTTQPREQEAPKPESTPSYRILNQTQAPAEAPTTQPAPHASPTPCQACMAKVDRYVRAIQTGMGAETSNNTYEAPRMVNVPNNTVVSNGNVDSGASNLQ